MVSICFCLYVVGGKFFGYFWLNIEVFWLVKLYNVVNGFCGKLLWFDSNEIMLFSVVNISLNECLDGEFGFIFLWIRLVSVLL